MIREIYDGLLTRKIVRSLRQFSTDFLCRAPNYAVDMKGPSAETLTYLHTKLMQAGQDDLALQVLLMIFDQAQEKVSKRVRRTR